MKQKNYLSAAVFILIWLPQLLFAQKSDTFLKMKPGDWFKMKVLYLTNDYSLGGRVGQYEIKYILKNTTPAGNRNYEVTAERISIVIMYPGTEYLGYDSYYPPYLQGSQQASVKPVYQLQVDKSGAVINLTTNQDLPQIELSEMAPKKKVGGMTTSQNRIDTGTVKFLSRTIHEAIATGNTGLFNGQPKNWTDENKLPSSLSVWLNAASFPLQNNTLVMGRVRNLTDTIKNIIQINGQSYKVSNDGSFQCSFFLKEGKEVEVTYGDYPKSSSITSFIERGDTLVIDADAGDFKRTAKFSGKAGAGAKLRAELEPIYKDQQVQNHKIDFKAISATGFMDFQQKGKAAFDQQLSAAKDKVPFSVRYAYENEFRYIQAKAKLEFLNGKNYLSTPEATYAFRDFPKDFFLSIDTLPVLRDSYQSDQWYTQYLNWFNIYQSNKIGMINGGQFGFLSEYAMSLTYLKGFPLYYSLSRSFNNELEHTTWKDAQMLKPYYYDFIGNCGDTALTNLVKQKWNLIGAWAPGSISPLSSLKLADETNLDLRKFKGKSLSITFNGHYPDEIKHLIERIKKADPKKIHFVIAQVVSENFPSGTIDSLLKSLPNVTYVTVNTTIVKPQKGVEIELFHIKTFVLDPEFKVVEDNIDELDKAGAEARFNKAVQKANSPKKMTKEDKATLMKTIGWSAGSIFVTFLIFFWIGKRRMAALKKQELVKRQIKELEIKAIRSQMNPHFLFNALNSIQSLINNHQYKEANIYLEKFSVLMRRVLNNSEKSFVSLSDELDAVELYCELEKLRFEFIFKIEIEDVVNADLIEIPGMIIQPLVENAIIHGLAQKGSMGILNIKITLDNNYLKIVITDNGPGLTAEADGASKHSGFGLKLVNERLNLLNTYGRMGQLILNSNLEDSKSGTTATLIIPID